ncbi:hypothetical protein Nepgr_018726 [Nepenthes gracilis]|uniref:Uncharacterized protein n=1 Tax=Nepenthes gracilis TaxID=150966 RepID=A0AAD3STZ6_NEPGR|nr:hypothetical protein Nepgr_018726 [Nepenthes gracilis]
MLQFLMALGSGCDVAAAAFAVGNLGVLQCAEVGCGLCFLQWHRSIIWNWACCEFVNCGGWLLEVLGRFCPDELCLCGWFIGVGWCLAGCYVGTWLLDLLKMNLLAPVQSLAGKSPFASSCWISPTARRLLAFAGFEDQHLLMDFVPGVGGQNHVVVDHLCWFVAAPGADGVLEIWPMALFDCVHCCMNMLRRIE